MAKDHGSSIKDDEQYEALRREGASKEKAARIGGAREAGSRDRDRGALVHEQGGAHRGPQKSLRSVGGGVRAANTIRICVRSSPLSPSSPVLRTFKSWCSRPRRSGPTTYSSSARTVTASRAPSRSTSAGPPPPIRASLAGSAGCRSTT